MDARLLVMAFQSLTMIGVLAALFLCLCPAARLDRFRQSMFAIRDELFDYAASGNVRFDDPAYRLLRQLMNGFIRFGHNLTFFRVCTDLATRKILSETPKLEWSEKWDTALRAVNDDKVRKNLTAFHDRVCLIVLWHLVTGSPFLLALVILGIIVALCRAGLASLGSILNRVMVETTSKLIDPKILDEEAAKAAV